MPVFSVRNNDLKVLENLKKFIFLFPFSLQDFKNQKVTILSGIKVI